MVASSVKNELTPYLRSSPAFPEYALVLEKGFPTGPAGWKVPVPDV